MADSSSYALSHFALSIPTSPPPRARLWRHTPTTTTHLKQPLLLSLRSSSSLPALLPQQRAHDYFRQDLRPIILFDGVCNLCNNGVNIVLDNDPKGNLRFAALQSEAGKALLQRCGRDRNDISSIVLVEKHGAYIKSEAVLRIANYLQQPLPLIAVFLHPFPLFLKDTVYDTVAANRYVLFGKTDQCRLTDASFEDRFIED